jgi:hypothetical protein
VSWVFAFHTLGDQFVQIGRFGHHSSISFQIYLANPNEMVCPSQDFFGVIISFMDIPNSLQIVEV